MTKRYVSMERYTLIDDEKALCKDCGRYVSTESLLEHEEDHRLGVLPRARDPGVGAPGCPCGAES